MFRVDSSVEIGTGHVMRCLVLADALRESGAQCHFICREHDGHLLDLVSSRNNKLDVLPKPSANVSFNSDLVHANWLGVDWLADMQQTQKSLGGSKVDWLIVDHYALDHRWESALRSSCKRIMVIDDLADRHHDCDLLLDQNCGSSTKRYVDLVPAACKQLHGPKFALLKPIYAQHRVEKSARSGLIKRVLIYFGGGADPMNLTGMALRAFQAPELDKIELDIVVGSNYAHRKGLEAAVLTRGKARIYEMLPDLSELMKNADLAVGAGGATTWERCCLGLPSILVVCALNQEAIGEAMRKLGAAIVLYPNDNLAADIQDQAVNLIADVAKYLEISERAWQICDGLGVQRATKIFAEFWNKTHV